MCKPGASYNSYVLGECHCSYLDNNILPSVHEGTDAGNLPESSRVLVCNSVSPGQRRGILKGHEAAHLL